MLHVQWVRYSATYPKPSRQHLQERLGGTPFCAPSPPGTAAASHAAKRRAVPNNNASLGRPKGFLRAYGPLPDRQLSPRVAGGNERARIEALARLRSFLAG